MKVQNIYCFSLLSGPGGGAFSRNFAINLHSHCRAFSGTLQSGMIKCPVFRVPVGAVVTNNWYVKPSLGL